MQQTRPQDLTEAVSSIIRMMLASIRARGWRGLLDLPMMWLFERQMRRYAQELTTLLADFKAGTLPPPPPPPAPAPWTDLPDRQAPCAVSPAPSRPAARPDPAARDRQHQAERPSPPPDDAAPDRPRAAAGLPHARGQPAVRPPRRAPDPFAVRGSPIRVLVTGRSP